MKWPLAIGLVIAAGVAVRLAMAWATRYSANGDFGIVALMARHMAQGVDFPVFFYGQPYMGGLEPLVSALMCFLLSGDSSAFPVNLGTALVSIGVLPLVYLLARDAGSRRAGLIAMLYCVVGADVLLHYSVAPRGGYMAMMVGGLLALWLACRAAAIEKGGGRAGAGLFWAMGIAAGIGWWATQLVAVFLVTAVVVLLSGWRWGFAWRGVVPGALGFILGSLPWWWWNATHEWASFDFSSSLGKVPFADGFASFRRLFLSVVEMNSGSWPGRGRLVLLGALAAGFAWILVRDKIRGVDKKAFYPRLAIPVLVLMMVLFYSTSHYVRANASRYLLPLVPVIAVMIGVSCDRLLRRFRFPWGWIVAVLVLPAQILVMNRMFDSVKPDAARWALAAKLADEVAPHCDGAFLGDFYTFHWLNYASRERICVAALPGERYADYARRIELAERPAILENYHDLEAFIAATRSSRQTVSVNGIRVDYAAVPPADDWSYVATSNLMVAREGEDATGVVAAADSSLDVSWSLVVPVQSTRSLVCVLPRPVPISGVRLLSFTDRYSGIVSIEGRSGTGGAWVPLMPPRATTRYFWSGPMLQLEGMQYYQEFRFAAPTGGVSEVRLTFHNRGRQDEAVRLNKILFLEPAVRQPLPLPGVGACVARLREQGVKQVYGPRWLAERIALEVSPEDMRVRAPSLLNRRLDDLPGRDPAIPGRVVFKGTTGLIMDERDAARSRDALRVAGVDWSEIQMGPLVLLVIKAKPAGTDPAVRLFWTEQGCFTLNSSDPQKAWPGAVPLKIRFQNRVELAGIAAGEGAEGGRVVVGSGQGFPLTYLWKCPPDVDLARWVAFVHFKSSTGKVEFQDDHMLFDNLPPDRLLQQEQGETFAETRQVQVPAGLAPGEYRVWMGLLERRSGQRIPVATDLDKRKKAVELPAVVTVIP